MQGQALPGFRDFYPDELALRNHIFATWREVARRYGFHEYDGPPLEPLELYTDKSGEEIVQQLYAFEDKGGRKVALRPEMTPTLARMVGAHAQALKKPIRWFSIPQLFRYERQQRGRLREHFQLNMDILGEASPLADAELIAAAIDIMRAFGLGPRDVQVRMSDRRVLRTLLLGRGLSEGQLGAALAAIDKSERDPKDVLAAKLREAGIGKRETDAVFEIAALRGLDAVLSALGKVKGGEEAGEPLRQAVGALEAMGLGDFVAVDLTIVRSTATKSPSPIASRAPTAWRSGSPASSPPFTLPSADSTASSPRSAAISNTASVSRFPMPASRSFAASTSFGSRSLLSIAASAVPSCPSLRPRPSSKVRSTRRSDIRTCTSRGPSPKARMMSIAAAMSSASASGLASPRMSILS